MELFFKSPRDGDVAAFISRRPQHLPRSAAWSGPGPQQPSAAAPHGCTALLPALRTLLRCVLPGALPVLEAAARESVAGVFGSEVGPRPELDQRGPSTTFKGPSSAETNACSCDDLRC